MSKLSPYSTYRTGILQARAYRNLRNLTVSILSKYDLTSSEWSILGAVDEATPDGGIRVGDLAKMLDVEMSFVTNMVKKLQYQGYATQVRDEDDGRVRLIVATDKAKEAVRTIELDMRRNMRRWMDDVPADDLVAYIRVIKMLSDKSHI